MNEGSIFQVFSHPSSAFPQGGSGGISFPFHQEILMSSDPQEGLVASVTRFFKQAVSTISGKA